MDEYNPFDEENFQYSNISFKNLYLSSMFNIGLFVGKSLIIQFIRGCYYKLRRDRNRQTNDKDQYQTCSLIYKRPKIEWCNENENIANNVISDGR